MDISMGYVANLLAERALPSLPGNASDVHRAEHQREVNLKSYDLQVGGFNISTVLLVSSVALAVIGLISMQAAFVVGALFLFVRAEVEKNLQKYQKPPTEEAAAELNKLVRLFGEKEFDIGDAVLENLGILRSDNFKWEPVEHKIFGHAVWMNTLPPAANH